MIREQVGCRDKKSGESIGMYNIELLDKEINKPVKIRSRLPLRYKNRFSPGICKLCGETFSMITNAHAHKHGFNDANEMANSSKVVFCTY